MSIFGLFRKKKPLDEETRREQLLRKGRITDGIILDNSLDSNGEIIEIFFTYTINGSDYESSQRLNEEQKKTPVKYAPGARVSVRYDPNMPGNSTVV